MVKKLGNADFSLQMLKSLTAKIMVLSSLIHKETIYSSEAKVAKLLIENFEIFYKLKHNEISSILNITPETLSRILKKFRVQGLIEGSKSSEMSVLDIDALYEVIETNKVKNCTNCIAGFKEKLGLDPNS